MIIFHTDLDNTLIYSYKHDIGEDKRCVEIYQGREISFITQETYRLLQKFHDGGTHPDHGKDQVIIVPTTTRTIEQYQRINLGVGPFEYALVCNGGVLLVNGVEDADWYQESLGLIGNSRNELQKALDILEIERRRTFEVRFIRSLFVFTKCEEPESVVEKLRGMLDGSFVDVFNNGVKVYVVPKILSKGKAVERFGKYIGADYVIAAGDSEFDISMLEAADIGIAAPGLAQSYSFHGQPLSERIICPPADRVYAEEVLRIVSRLLCGYNRKSPQQP